MGQPKLFSGNKPNSLRGINHTESKNKYMARTKPAYRSVGLQERKVGGKKKNQS